MTLGKMVVCQKDPSIGNVADKHRPISCLTLIRKLMTGTIAESIYNFLDANDNLTVEQNRRKKRRSTKDQLLNKTILCDCRKRQIDLEMAWIDCKKAL